MYGAEIVRSVLRISTLEGGMRWSVVNVPSTHLISDYYNDSYGSKKEKSSKEESRQEEKGRRQEEAPLMALRKIPRFGGFFVLQD